MMKENTSKFTKNKFKIVFFHLSLQGPFHSIFPQGFLMRIMGMVSFLK